VIDTVNMELDRSRRHDNPVGTFSRAVWENDFQMLHGLDKAGSAKLPKAFLNSPDDKRYTPLHYVSSVGDVKMSEILLEQGSNINIPDKDGNTALLWAAKKGKLQVVISLVEKFFACVNIQNFAGDSTLSYATANNDAQMVLFLLDNGASPNTRNLRGETPLHIAAALGYVKILELLVKNGGAWLEVEDEVGDTPLHFAVREGQVEAIECLLNLGADPGHSNEDDETPIVLAEDLGDTKIIRIFEQLAGGSSNVAAADADDHLNFDSHIKLLSTEVSKLSLAN